MRRRPGISFDALAGLQRLATFAKRRAVEEACAETDRCDGDAVRTAAALAESEQVYAEAHGDARLCLTRLAVVAAIVNADGDAVQAAGTTLEHARSAEADAGAEWLLAKHREGWLADRARVDAQRLRARRDERADAESRTRRLAAQRNGART